METNACYNYSILQFISKDISFCSIFHLQIHKSFFKKYEAWAVGITNKREEINSAGKIFEFSRAVCPPPPDNFACSLTMTSQGNDDNVKNMIRIFHWKSYFECLFCA